MFFASIACAQSSDTLKVLFIGNSYTAYNDLPQLFVKLAQSSDKKAYAERCALGGYSLEQHYNLGLATQNIHANDWDFVVLQEQSQHSTIDYYRYNSMYPFARAFDSLITSQGAQTVFFSLGPASTAEFSSKMGTPALLLKIIFRPG